MSAQGTPLAGRVAVVTGASGKLGPVWIRSLADAGATVAAIDIVAGAAPAGSAMLEVADVTDRAAVERAVDAIENRLGPVGVLVNNAGIDNPPALDGRPATIEAIPIEEFRRVFDVNVAGAFNVSQVVGPRMVRARTGSIINIGSLYASIAPDPTFYEHFDPPFLKPPAYGASKAALVNLTRYLARLWGSAGVRVNAFSPGGVLGDQDPDFLAKFSRRTALGRLAEAADLKGPLVFLASDASQYVTGQELRADGGFTA